MSSVEVGKSYTFHTVEGRDENPDWDNRIVVVDAPSHLPFLWEQPAFVVNHPDDPSRQGIAFEDELEDLESDLNREEL